MEIAEPIRQTPVKKKPVWLIVLIPLLALVAYFLTANVRDYNKAEKLFLAGDYTAASAIYAELG